MSCLEICNGQYMTDITAAWEALQQALLAAGNDQQKRKEAIEEWETQRQAIYNAWLSCLEGCNEA